MSCHPNGTFMSLQSSDHHQQYEINFQAQRVPRISSHHSIGYTCSLSGNFLHHCTLMSLVEHVFFWMISFEQDFNPEVRDTLFSLSDACNLRVFSQRIGDNTKWPFLSDPRDLDIQSFIQLGEYDLKVKVNDPFMSNPYEPTGVKWGE